MPANLTPDILLVLTAAAVFFVIIGVAYSRVHRISKVSGKDQAAAGIVIIGERSIRLALPPDDPATRYAPQRWSTEFRHQKIRKTYTECRDRLQPFIEECNDLSQVVCPDARLQSSFMYELNIIQKNITERRESYAKRLVNYTDPDIRSDWMDGTQNWNLKEQLAARSAIDGLRNKYAIPTPRIATQAVTVSQAALQFNQGFFNKTVIQREEIIAKLMRERQLSRDQAMQHAVDQLRLELRSWR